MQLKDVQAGEVRQFVVDLQAERYWQHEGVVAVIPVGTDTPADVSVELSTLVYP